MFKVSDKVVRITPPMNMHNFIHQGEPIEKGTVYVVRWSGEWNFQTGWQAAIRLVGCWDDCIIT